MKPHRLEGRDVPSVSVLLPERGFHDVMNLTDGVAGITHLKLFEESDSNVTCPFNGTEVVVWGSSTELKNDLRNKPCALIVNWKT